MSASRHRWANYDFLC